MVIQSFPVIDLGSALVNIMLDIWGLREQLLENELLYNQALYQNIILKLEKYKYMERMGKWYIYTPINTETSSSGNTAYINFESITYVIATGNETCWGLFSHLQNFLLKLDSTMQGVLILKQTNIKEVLLTLNIINRSFLWNLGLYHVLEGIFVVSPRAKKYFCGWRKTK